MLKIFKKVDFPVPLAPTRPYLTPRFNENEAPSKSVLDPNFKDKFEIENMLWS